MIVLWASSGITCTLATTSGDLYGIQRDKSFLFSRVKSPGASSEKRCHWFKHQLFSLRSPLSREFISETVIPTQSCDVVTATCRIKRRVISWTTRLSGIRSTFLGATGVKAAVDESARRTLPAIISKLSSAYLPLELPPQVRRLPNSQL